MGSIAQKVPHHFKEVLVFCGSRFGESAQFLAEAKALGRLLGTSGYNVVYGGGNNGLMGVVANEALAHGAGVHAIIPEGFMPYSDHTAAIRMTLVKDLFQRKSSMLSGATASIILPGGIGTLDEIFEVAASNDFRVHEAPEEHFKPIIILNLNGFYEGIRTQMERCVAEGFIKPERLAMFHFVPDAAAVIEKLNELEAAGIQPAKILGVATAT